MDQIAIFWFRRDLRVEDNKGLFEALQSGLPVLPVFIFDTNIINDLNPDDPRLNFIYDTLYELNNKLAQNQSGIKILHTTPSEAFQQLSSEFNVKEVFTNHDYEPYALSRDQQIETLLDDLDIEFHSFKDQVIFEKSEVVKKDGSPYTVYTPYMKVWKSQFQTSMTNSFESENDLSKLYPLSHSFPSKKDLGIQENDIKVLPFDLSSDLISNYDDTRNFPSKSSGSRLSPHLRFGTISIRRAVKQALKYNGQFLNELIWREFFMQILYHFPYVVDSSFKKKYDNIPWRNNEDLFEKWCNGETGYPIVDAGMRELNTTGYMHNRVRMITASFLCKHLLIDWRWGESYFAEKLLDYELSSNNGNWQWVAGCGCDAAPYFRVFNPSEQQRKFDPDNVYCNKWIPDYKDGHYIEPIVDHKTAREEALAVYKKALTIE